MILKKSETSINAENNLHWPHSEQDKLKKGKEIHDLIAKLYPICRSITGNGVRKTLEIIKEIIPIDIHEVPSGTEVYDWTVPKEWNIRDAWIKNSSGEKIVDFKKTNLQVLNYSVPIHEKRNLAELKIKLFTLKEHPSLIPYLTTYYKEDWGFCITHDQFRELKEDTYEVFIDSELKEGSLTYGELFIKGEREEEFLLSSYICHPSLCNDNLSGPALLVYVAKAILELKSLGVKQRYSYRFLFIPETIGAITWLSRNEQRAGRIKHGLIATCTGDSGISTYKKSRQGNSEIDKAAEKILQESGEEYKIVEFFPSGSDERQFCSPGFNLPVGSLMRTMYGCFPEYHTSADDLEFVKPEFLGDTFTKYLKIIFVIENNTKYLSTNLKCEPRLGKRGLYSSIGSQKSQALNELAVLWTMNMSDGKNSLLDIAIRSDLPFEQIKNAANALEKHSLLKEI